MTRNNDLYGTGREYPHWDDVKEDHKRLMNIAAVEFNPDHEAIEIYLAGCKAPHCDGCHNPELWSFDVGTDWREHEGKLTDYYPLFGAEKAFIMGGEPLDQPNRELVALLEALRYNYKEVWLFTGHLLEMVPYSVQCRTTHIKAGPYKERLRGRRISHGIELASVNQKVFIRGVDYGNR